MDVIVIVGKKMADLEEIENLYKINVEKEDESFLSKLNDPINKGKQKELELEYRKNLSLLLDEYKKNVAKFLGQKDVELFVKNEIIEEDTKKEKISGSLKVKPLSLKLSFVDRFKISFKVFKFNFRIFFRDLTRKIFPARVIFMFLNLKFLFLSSYFDLKYFLSFVFSRVWMFCLNFLMRIKNFFFNVFTLIKNFFSKIFAKILSFFKKEETEKETGIKTNPLSSVKEEQKV